MRTLRIVGMALALGTLGGTVSWSAEITSLGVKGLDKYEDISKRDKTRMAEHGMQYKGCGCSEEYGPAHYKGVEIWPKDGINGDKGEAVWVAFDATTMCRGQTTDRYLGDKTAYFTYEDSEVESHNDTWGAVGLKFGAGGTYPIKLRIKVKCDDVTPDCPRECEVSTEFTVEVRG